MAMASPTPMGSSHFASLSKRPSSRQANKQPPWRPHLSRGEPHVAETHTRHYSLNDSSDDEIPMPMKLSAYTDALLNGETSMVEKSPIKSARTNPGLDEIRQFRAGSVSSIEVDKGDRISPSDSRVHSPYPRRVIRLSGTPGSSTLRRNKSLSTAVQKHNEPIARTESPLDLSTPAQVPRTVRIPITATAHNGVSAGSSGKLSSRTNSGSRSGEEEVGSQEHSTTIARSHLATSQGSVSRYGSSTIGRTRYDEDLGLASSMRVRKVPGRMMAQAARRGRRRVDDEGQSPLEEQSDGLDNAGSSSDPKSQESQVPESQVSDLGSSQDPEANRASLYSTAYRDFASGSPVSSKDILNPVLRSKSPPPPTLSSSQRSATADSNSRPAKQEQPIFKVPAPRPDLPSAQDQENEAPPTFKRNKQAPLIQFDKLEKVPVRPESLDLSVLRAAVSPERRPLAPRSQNTPRRPAPPPPKMSILDAATSTAGAATTTQAGAKKNRLKVNGKQFTRLDCIGRGGSSRVYRVMAENSQFFALKRVSLEDADEMAVAGFKGEIDLLQKLKGVERVIRLWDYELNEAKGTLSVVSNPD
jgi:serine/threonine-protein kinase TTK/MPS1